MKLSYRHTLRTCYLGYVVGVIVNNFTPLLLTAFATEFSLPVTQPGTLVVMNFAVQMLVDFTGAYIAEKTGCRTAIVTAQLLASAGLISLDALPYIMADKRTSILLALVMYAVGGGMIEVLVSPITKAVPGEDKPSNMSILHSFFLLGQRGGHTRIYRLSGCFRGGKLEIVGYCVGNSTPDCRSLVFKGAH